MPPLDNEPPDRIEIFYKAQDVAPYRIMVEANQTNNGLAQKINKFNIGKNLKDVGYVKSILDILPINKKKAAIFTDNYKTANDICKNADLKNKYKIYIPHYFVTVSGVISGVPTDIPNDEIMNNIKAPNTEITEIQRLKRKVNGEFIDSWRMKVTFRTNKLPENVRLFNVIAKIRPFIRKANFCDKCLRYNHREQNCRSERRCSNCTKAECPGCQVTPICMYCQRGHKTNDTECEERRFQNKINKIMAVKSMLYIEARKFVTTGTNIYDNLAQFDDPTPAESATINNRKEKNSYAYVWRNPRKSRSTSKRRSPSTPNDQLSLNRSRSNSKRRSPNVSERQESPEINEPKRTKNDGLESRLLQVQNIESNKSLTFNQKEPAEAASSHNNIMDGRETSESKSRYEKAELKNLLTKRIEEKQKEITIITRMHDTRMLSKDEYNKSWEELNNDLKKLKKAKADLEEIT